MELLQPRKKTVLSERRNEEVIWTKRSLLPMPVLQKRGRFEYRLCSEDPSSSEKFTEEYNRY